MDRSGDVSAGPPLPRREKRHAVPPRPRQNPLAETPLPPDRMQIARRSIMLATDDDILAKAQEWKEAGKSVAMATVVSTWGSAPRPVGSHLVIDGDGNFLGSVSGGCVEGAVVTEALAVIETAKPKLLEFGVSDETAWRVGRSCGGRIKVYVEKLI